MLLAQHLLNDLVHGILVLRLVCIEQWRILPSVVEDALLWNTHFELLNVFVVDVFEELALFYQKVSWGCVTILLILTSRMQLVIGLVRLRVHLDWKNQPCVLHHDVERITLIKEKLLRQLLLGLKFTVFRECIVEPTLDFVTLDFL